MKNASEQTKPAFTMTFPATPHGFPVTQVRLAGVLVIALLIVQHGFPVSRQVFQVLNVLDVLLALYFAADLVVALVKSPGRMRDFELRRFEYFLLALFLLLLGSTLVLSSEAIHGLLKFLHLRSTAALRLNLVDLFLLLCLCVQLLRGTQRLIGKGTRPELILAGSFAMLIVLGTLLLLLPNSSANVETPIGVLDAFFTATSATCVTGLAVRDTGLDFSAFGQMVILTLFQVGGLGIITFVAFLSVFSARTLPVPQMVAFRQMVNAPAASDLKRQIVGILAITGVIELIGIVLVFHSFEGGTDALDRLKWSVFHAVSAFCNAGFALHSNSLESHAFNGPLMFTFMVLIILGSLSFLTIPELLGFRFTRLPLFRKIAFFRRIHAGQTQGRLSVQTKISLTVTALLLVGGLFAFWALEFNSVLRERSFGESFLVAAFQSVTTRTAGFNTVPIAELRDATLVFVMMLMVVGANPVSTGGGIKTVNLGILIFALRAMVTRRDRVEAFGRTIPVRTLFAALSVFVIYILSAGAGIFLLSLFDPQMKLQDQAFEVISALSTVGLSTGITADLSPASKLVLCVAMFVGRIGPISLVLSVFQSRRTLDYEYPEEEVVVG